MSAALATTEQQRLDTLEATIERGLATFVEVGEALMEIRDARLYRPHQTFEDYCRDRWLFSDRRARQLMSAAEIGTIVPVANEAQARELAPLLAEPEALREAWAEVVELLRVATTYVVTSERPSFWHAPGAGDGASTTRRPQAPRRPPPLAPASAVSALPPRLRARTRP